MVRNGPMHGARLLTQMTPGLTQMIDRLIIITPGMPYAIGFALQASAQVPQRLMMQLNPRGLSQCLASFVCLPAAATCASSLATSMQRATSPFLFPRERGRTFFLLGGIALDARRKRENIFSSWRDRTRCTQSEVGDQEAEWRCSRWHLLQGRKHRGHGAPCRSLLGRSWPTEVTNKQPGSDQGAL